MPWKHGCGNCAVRDRDSGLRFGTMAALHCVGSAAVHRAVRLRLQQRDSRQQPMTVFDVFGPVVLADHGLRL